MNGSLFLSSLQRKKLAVERAIAAIIGPTTARDAMEAIMQLSIDDMKELMRAWGWTTNDRPEDLAGSWYEPVIRG